VPDFANLPLSFNLLALAVAGAVVWLAGTRLSRYAAAISERSGIGQAVIGMLLLAAVSSLPEIAITVTSTLDDVAALAINNLLGGAALQVTLLALADALLVRGALTHVVAKPSALIQGVLLILMLAMFVAGVVVGDRPLLGVGLWCWAILCIYLAAIWTIAHARDAWVPGTAATTGGKALDTGDGLPDAPRGESDERLVRLIVKTVIAAASILVAGYALARTGEAIAEQSGLGASFVGAVVLAFVTSLPEMSTIYGAVKLGRYVMAVSEVFGTAMFNVALVFLVDAVYAGAPVLTEAGAFSGFAALLLVALVAVYVVGLLERRDTVVLRMGLDSLIVLIFYFGGLAVLYRLH